MPKSSAKKPYAIKSIYKKIPKEKKNYLIIYKQLHTISKNIYIIKTVNNLNTYLNNHKKSKILLFRYYILNSTETFDFSIIHQYCEDSDEYKIDNIEIIYSLISEKFKCDYVQPELNTRLNPSIRCDCKFLPDCIVELHDHLLCCPTYEYTLFGEEVPKHLRPTKATVKKIVNNNTTNHINVTNNYQFNISVRQIGDFLREKLPDEEKIRILNSMDKIGEMVRQHFLFPEINRTLRVKNSNMYTGHSTCFDGKEFVTKPNKDLFYYYILDHLDSLDFMAYDLKDDRVTRNLEKYDDNIRKNEKNMREKIQQTIATVKDLQDKIK